MVTYTKAGFTDFLAEYGGCNLTLEVVKPNFIVNNHSEHNRFIYVLKGSGDYKLDLGPVKRAGVLKFDDYLRVPSGFVFTVKNTDEDSLIILYIEKTDFSS